MRLTRALVTVTMLAAVTLTGCMTLPELENHNACFLGAGASIRYMNILSPHLSRDAFKGYVAQQKDMGANFVYVFTINEHDGPWTPYSPYSGNDIGGQIDEGVAGEYEWRMEHIRSEGLGIVIWLRADDSPTFNRTPQSKQEQYQRDMVARYDDYASAYCVGLELNEYMGSGAVEHYAAQLQTLTEKPVMTHQTSGRWDMAGNPSVDVAGVQYGFGKSAGYVENMTRNAVGQLGKPVYGVEYHKSSETEEARSLGDAVMRGGAKGTGNNRHNPPDPQDNWWNDLF